MAQKSSTSVESQTESESDSDSEFALLEKPSKPKAILPSNSAGGEESARKSDQDTDLGGGGDAIINEEWETETPKQPLPRSKRNCKRKPILTYDKLGVPSYPNR